MDIDIIFLCKLLSDFGLLVLIWLVQLVIYPSFKYYEISNLKRWHKLYTKRLTVVVLPLMLSQLVLSIYILVQSSWATFEIIDFIFVLLTWVSTFAVFVPLHQNITQNKDINDAVYKLIKYNWFRTAIWTIIPILSLFKALT